jgi:plastocyanin
VTFENSAVAETSAAFSASGAYVLRCTATTADGSGSADLMVNIAPAAAADPTLAQRLKLDESSGTTAADSSGNNLNATASGGLAWQPSGGVLTGAASFNGTDSYLAVPDSNLLDNSSALTLSFWFRANTLGNNTGLVSKRVTFDSNNSYSTFLGLDGKLTVDINSNNNRFTSNTTFNTGNWYHVALVFDGSLTSDQRAKLYVNGVLDKTAAETSTAIPNTTAALHIGVLAASGGNIFDGLIDEVRIHRRALSAAEVLAMRNETGTYGPNVSAGTPPAAIANEPAALNGSAMVEAGPAPTVLWTKISGPGNVVFANPASAATTVTFDQDGDYVLRLTATNANGTTFADLAETVFPGTLPAPGLAITNPPAPVSIPDTDHRLRLTATAETYHVPGTPVFAWTMISGPGTITFANPAAADTTATFSAPGTYLLRCTATNDAGTATAQTSVTIGSTTASIGLREGNGYSHVGTFIRKDTPTWNSGARDQLIIGKLTGGNPLRGIFSFPLDVIPPVVSLTNVSLDLWTHPVEVGTGTLQTFELRPLSGNPVEGIGNSSSSSSINGNGTGATWLNRAETIAWNTAGGDFSGTVLASLASFDPTVKSALRSFASTPALVSATQSSLTAAASLDLMLISPGTESLSESNYARFASDDHPDPNFRPRLNVSWSTTAAPAITLGTAPAALNGIPVALSASISNATSILWTLASGPGEAEFSNPATPSTSVTFDQPGSYQILLTATGPHGETSRTLVIEVSPNPGVFADWQALTWPGIDDPEITGPSADPDGDSRVNLLEWALHLDPNQADGFTPAITVPGDTVEFTYTRRKTAPGEVSFFVEWSDTLGDDWSDVDVVSDPPVSIDATRESVRCTLPAGLSGRRFMRVLVYRHGS